MVRGLTGPSAAAAADAVPVVWNGRRFLRVRGGRTDATPVARLIANAARTAAKRSEAPKAGQSSENAEGGGRGARLLYGLLCGLSDPSSLVLRGGADLRTGDVLLLPDAIWGSRIPLDIFNRLRSDGITLASVAYDLLPLRRPEYFEPELVRQFAAWYERASSDMDFWLAISRHTGRDLTAYLAARGRGEVPVRVLPLGTDLDASSGPQGPIRPHVRSWFDRPGPHVLCVGTIEPRKNHELVLDAFELHWSRGGTATLLVAGRRGWLCERISARLDRHSERSRRLHVAHDLTDAELRFAYGHATAAVSASHDEGYGLPVVEGERYGAAVLASDIPSHREVAGKETRFFRPDDPAGLAGLIDGLGPTRPPRGTIDGAACAAVTWKDSGAALRRLVDELAGGTRRSGATAA